MSAMKWFYQLSSVTGLHIKLHLHSIVNQGKIMAPFSMHAFISSISQTWTFPDFSCCSTNPTPPNRTTFPNWTRKTQSENEELIFKSTKTESRGISMEQEFTFSWVTVRSWNFNVLKYRAMAKTLRHLHHTRTWIHIICTSIVSKLL